MVWMGVGDNDKFNLFRRYLVLLHLFEELAEIMRMTWIDENGLFSLNHIGVTVVLIRILPKIGKESLLKFHPLSF